jgi:MoaA/NifB/PqqE/SkfB family radical SAM enzyme
MSIIDGRGLFDNAKNHLDIYLNFFCNLRCNHCFLGTELDRKESFSIDSAISLLNYARSSGCEEVSFLGGEPTIHKNIWPIIQEAFILDYKSVKVITNGLRSFDNFMKKYEAGRKPTIVFSFDGIQAATFEKIRGKGTYDRFRKNIQSALTEGYTCAGIISVSKDNFDEVVPIIYEMDRLGFEYVNIHHVNDLGFANGENIVPPDNWLVLKEMAAHSAEQLNIKIKFENKFVPVSDKQTLTNCVIQQEKGGNIMVFPDGRVYRCALFFNSKGFNSLTWDGYQMITNNHLNEKLLCGDNGQCDGCAASRLFNLNHASEEAAQYRISCMYQKEVL